MIDRINGIAERTEEDGVNVLAGENDFAASNIGTDIGSAAGFASFDFDEVATGYTASGDSFTLAYDSASGLFTLTNTTTGRVERVEGPASAPSAGDTDRVFFTDFGLVLTLDENFDIGTDIDPATDDAGFDVGGTLSTRSFDVQVGTRTEEGDSVAISLEPAFIGALSSDLRTADLLSAANAAAAETAIAEAQQVLAGISGTVAGIQQQLGEVSYESGRNEGVLRESAEALLRQADQRRELFKILSSIALDFVTPTLTAPLRAGSVGQDPFQVAAFQSAAPAAFSYASAQGASVTSSSRGSGAGLDVVA